MSDRECQKGETPWDCVQRGDYAAALERFQLKTARTNPRLLGDTQFMNQAFCYWSLGYPEEAVAVLRQAMITPYQAPLAGSEPRGLLLYAGERLHAAGIRREAVALLRKHARRAHPTLLVKYLLEMVDEKEFMDNMVSMRRDRGQCMADFFIGLRGLREGNRDVFKERMIRCAENAAASGQAEYHLAKWEVGNGFPERVQSRGWWPHAITKR